MSGNPLQQSRYTVDIAQASTSGDAVITTTYADDGVAKGSSFTFEKNINISIGATVYVLFDYSTYTPDPTKGEFGQVYVLPPSFATTAGPVLVNLYRGTDYIGGTPFPAYNPNITATKTVCETTLTINPTGTVKGTLALEYLVGGDGTNQNTASGSSTGLSFFIRANTGKALVEIINQSTKAIIFHYGQVLYEI